MLGPWKSISGWSIVTSSLFEYGRRPLIKIIMLIYLSENVVKFGMLNQLMIMIEVIWPKFKFLTSRWCGRTPYWKTSVLEITRQWVVRFSWNLYEDTKSGVKWRSNLKDFKLWKFEMADNRHLESRYVAIFQCNVCHQVWVTFHMMYSRLGANDANSAFHPSGVGKWVPAKAGE